MGDDERIHISRDVNVTGGDFVAGNKTIINQPGPAPAELTPEQLAAAETRYRAQVVERYNRLGFAGLGISGSNLSELPLDDVFVRLTLTVEKTVHEPIPPEEWAREREEPSNRFFRRGVKKEDDRPRERIVTVQEPITLGDALAQHALIVGEPGAGKSTLLRWLAVTFAAGSQRETDRLGPQADADRLPLLVELGRLPEAYLQANSRETPNWKTFLPEHLTKQPPFDDIPAAFLEQALAAGRCLLLCDGLDEIADLSARRRLADSLADYARTSANRLVLSSRPAGVSGSEASLGSRFQRLTIQRFAPEDVRRFFGFIYAQDSELTSDEASEEADRLYAVVESQPKTLELATTPLLATLLLLLWNQDGYLPERRVELYERCCQMLIESWESQHDVAYTGVLVEIGWERHLRLLAPLAYAIHNTGQRTDAPASELIPVLAQAMQAEGLATPASAILEAEKFLRALSLRSGLLQFLGSDRYGFPHLTFQEYLTARYIAAQPDPDYIDLVMVHIHKAWWREVHLLVIGHLGSGSEGAETKCVALVQVIISCYSKPLWLLRSEHLTDLHLPWPHLRRHVASITSWQIDLRLAWILAREFQMAASEIVAFMHGDEFRLVRQRSVQILIDIMRDPARTEPNQAEILELSIGVLDKLGGIPAHWRPLVTKWIAEREKEEINSTHTSPLIGFWDYTEPSVDALMASGESQLLESPSPEKIDSLIATWKQGGYYGDRAVAARNLGILGKGSTRAALALAEDLNHPNIRNSWPERKAAAESLGQLGMALPEVITALLAVFENSDPFGIVSIASAKSLAMLGITSEDVITTLISALNRYNRGIREAAMESLIILAEKSPEVLQALENVLARSRGGDACVMAARALGQIGTNTESTIAELIRVVKDENVGWEAREAAARSLGKIGNASDSVVSALSVLLFSTNSRDEMRAAAKSIGDLGILPPLLLSLADSSWGLRRIVAAETIGQLKLEDETQLRTVLIVLNRRLHDRNDDVRRAALTAIRQLLDGRQIPGYRWVPIREQQRRARVRRRIGWAVLALGLVVLALCIGGVVNGQVDFTAGWVRVAGGLAGLASLAAGVDLWLAHRRRPPWE